MAKTRDRSARLAIGPITIASFATAICAVPAEGHPIVWGFEGVITGFPSSSADSPLEIGTRFSGEIRLDADPDLGTTRHEGGPGVSQSLGWGDPSLGIRLHAGGLDFSIFEESYKGVTIYDDAFVYDPSYRMGDGLTVQAFGNRCYPFSPQIPSCTPLPSIQISLIDHDQTVLSDAELSAQPPLLSELELAQIAASMLVGEPTLGGAPITVGFYGVIDRLVVVPEPSSVSLFAFGLAALAARRWRPRAAAR